MANAQVHFRLIENSRGGQTLVHNGYMFRLKMGKEESRYWYCQKKDCPARINTKNDNITKASGIHNHMQDQTAISVAEMKSNMRKRVRESIEPIPSIFTEMVTSVRTDADDAEADEVVKRLPTFYTAKSSLYRQRAKLVPILPKNRQDIHLEGKWTQTTTGEQFLLVDDGDEQRVLIFATRDNLMELSASSTWYMDGTFYASPSYFCQMYTIHAMINGFMCPLVYGLLPNKTRTTYDRFFTLLQNAADGNNIRLTPEHVMMDFETAAWRSVKEVFQDVTVKDVFSIIPNVSGEMCSRVVLRQISETTMSSENWCSVQLCCHSCLCLW